MTQKLITAPAFYPVTLSESKVHLRLETAFTDDDDHVTSLIAAATAYAESFCNRRLITQTWEKTFDSWSDVEADPLPFGQLQKIDQITWLDEDGASDTVTASNYIVSGVATDNGRVEFDDDVTMSTDLYQVDPIQVRFTCGYYPHGTAWAAETGYSVGDQVLVNYDLVAECTVSGTSHTGAPIWPGTIDETVTDATVTWQIVGVAIPSALRQAIFILITQFYENREPSLNDTMERAINNMLLFYRIWS